MVDIDFIFDFERKGDLNSIVKDLEKINSLGKTFGKTTSDSLKQIIKDFNDYQRGLTEIQKKLQSASDVKTIAALTEQVAKMKKEYDDLKNSVAKLNDERKKSKQLTDEELKAQVTASEALTKRRKAIREAIKDQQALEVATKKEVRSIADLQEKTNALVRVRSKLDLSNKEQKKQFDQLTQEINKNNAALKQHDATIGRHQRNVGNYPNVARGLIRTAAVLGGVGLGITAVSSVIGGSIQDFQKFDGQLRETQAILGISDEQLEIFRQKALAMGEGSRTGANEYLEAVKLIASAKPELVDNTEALDDVTKKAITLSEAAGIDLPTAATALTDALNQFNAPAEDAGKFINVLAAGSKFGAAEVPQVTEALLKFGLQADSSNVSIEESTALIELLAEKGEKGAEAGTKLRNILLNLSNAKGLPKEALKAFKEAGVDITKLSDKSLTLDQRLKEASKLLNTQTGLLDVFGKENVIAAQAVLQNTDRIEELRGKISGKDGLNAAYEQAAITGRSAAAEAERLANKAEVLRIRLGEKLAPIVNKLKIGFYQLAEAVLAPVTTEIIAKYENIGQLLANMFEDQRQLSNKIAENLKANLTTLNPEKIQRLQSGMAILNDELKKSTELTRKEGQKLIDQYNEGKISFDEFQASAGNLIKLEIERRKGTKENIKAIKEETKAEEDGSGKKRKLTKEEIAANEKARKDAFDKALKRLEEEKTRRLIEIENTITDERAKQIALLELEIEFGNRKIAVQNKFNESTVQESLKVLQEETALMKQEEKNREEDLKKQEELLNIQDQLEIENMENDRDRDKAQAQFDFEQEVKKLEDEGKLTRDIEKALKEKLRQELRDIDAKYDKEELDAVNEQLEKIDEQFDKEMKELEEKRKAQVKEFFDFVNGIGDALEQEMSKRIDRIQNELERGQEFIDAQRELAQAGQENTLVFEQEIQAQRQKQLLEEQRKQEKIKLAEMYFEAVVAYSKDNPNTAPARALAQTLIARAIAAKLEKGGVLEEEVKAQGGSLGTDGIFRGQSHKEGGIQIPAIEFEGEEGILSKKEMRKLGKDNFHNLKKALSSPNADNNYYSKSSEQAITVLQQKQQTVDISPLVEEMKEVKKAINDKPVSSMNIDQHGNIVTTKTAKNYIHKIIHKNKGFNG